MRPMGRISAVHFSTSRLGDHHPRALRTSRNFSALLGQRYARLELKGQIGVVVVGWDWGTGEWAKSSTLLSCGAAFGTVL
jgi:hypothetical protein